MFDDIPKGSPLKKIFYTILILAILGVAAFYFYQKYFAKTDEVKAPAEEITDENTTSTSTKPTATAASPTPTVAATPDYRLPTGETYVTSSAEDTNGDGKLETLVISAQTDGKFHAYVLSNEKTVLFETKDLTKKPARIDTQVYKTGESYDSWMVVMSENSSDLFFIHWNATTYEIPQDTIF